MAGSRTSKRRTGAGDKKRAAEQHCAPAARQIFNRAYLPPGAAFGFSFFGLRFSFVALWPFDITAVSMLACVTSTKVSPRRARFPDAASSSRPPSGKAHQPLPEGVDRQALQKPQKRQEVSVEATHRSPTHNVMAAQAAIHASFNGLSAPDP